MDAITVARLATPHYTFTTAGLTADEARQYMRTAWEIHARETGASWTFDELADDVQVCTLRPGSILRDGEPFATVSEDEAERMFAADAERGDYPDDDEVEAFYGDAGQDLADRIRAEVLPGIEGGIDTFLQEPGGYIDYFGIDANDYAAIDAIVDVTNAAILQALAKAGITGGFVMDPGPGTVHVPTPLGTAFLSDPDGGYLVGYGGWSVGYTFSDGSEEREVRTVSGGKFTDGVAALIEAVRNAPTESTDLVVEFPPRPPAV